MTRTFGDPKRDRFETIREKQILSFRTLEQARRLIDEGYNVKLTKPREGEEEDSFLDTMWSSKLITIALGRQNIFSY